MLPLTTERLTVRMLREHDLDTFTEYRQNPEIAKYQDWDLPYADESARRLVDEQSDVDDVTNGRWVQLAVESEGELVGDVAVGLSAGGQVATIGYTLAPAHHGKGFATEAVSAVVDALIARGVHRFEATLDPENIASQRVLESVGFTFEVTVRKAAFVRGEWVDDMRYGMLADDRVDWLARPRHAPSVVELVEVTPEDAYLWARLVTHKSQENFVSPTRVSYTDALFPESVDGGPVVPWIRGVMADGERVAFVMMAEVSEFHPHPYLWRLLIDRRHQRRGIGERIIQLLVEQLRAEGHEVLVTSYGEGPGGPAPFYARQGFVPTGEMLDGEVETRLTLS